MRLVAALLLVCSSFGMGLLCAAMMAPQQSSGPGSVVRMSLDAGAPLAMTEDAFCLAPKQIEFDFIPLAELEATTISSMDESGP